MEAYEVLEQRLAEVFDVHNVVACSSGTAALHLALEALQLPAGSKVLVPNVTMVACARAVVLAGLTPVFVDCRPRDLLIDPQLVEECLRGDSGEIKAVMAVHLYGRVCDMDHLAGLADHYGLRLIEDLAEAHGVKPHEDTDAACWSFYRNKIVAGEEGGAVSLTKAVHTQRARQLRCLGFTESHDFNHLPRGHNYRMSNAHANLILPGLDQMNRNLELRRQAVAYYRDATPNSWLQPPATAPWVYDLRLRGSPSPGTVNRVVEDLNRQGIAARHCFKPMTGQSEFAQPWRGDVCQTGEVFYLPVTPDLTQGECVRRIRMIQALVGG